MEIYGEYLIFIPVFSIFKYQAMCLRSLAGFLKTTGFVLKYFLFRTILSLLIMLRFAACSDIAGENSRPGGKSQNGHTPIPSNYFIPGYFVFLQLFFKEAKHE